jgi:hypothetical protein
LSFSLGVDANGEQMLEKIGDCGLARDTFERIEKNLAANGAVLKSTPMKPGPWLTIGRQIDAISRRGGKDATPALAKADKPASGYYRRPFAVDEHL